MNNLHNLPTSPYVTYVTSNDQARDSPKVRDSPITKARERCAQILANELTIRFLKSMFFS